MARFDVYARRDGHGLVLDCQADVLSRQLDTRFVVPLLPPTSAPLPARRLNPLFDVDGESYVMVTQFAATMSVRDLGARVTSLLGDDFTITSALDFLMCGV